MTDEKAALLAEILSERVPDPSLSLPVIEPEIEKPVRRLLTVCAIGGRRVVVVEEPFKRLVEIAGLDIHGDVSHAEFGRLLSAAKDTNRNALMVNLLDVRCSVTPLYRVRTEEGRPWFSRPRPIEPIVSEEFAIEQDSLVAL